VAFKPIICEQQNKWRKNVKLGAASSPAHMWALVATMKQFFRDSSLLAEKRGSWKK